MDYNDVIKRLKSKIIPTASKQYKQNRAYCILHNGTLKEDVQHVKNEKYRRSYKMSIKKHQIKQIEHFFSTSSLSRAIKKMHALETKLELSELVIKYFKIIHPNYDLQQIKQEFINGINEKSQVKNNDDTDNQLDTYTSQSNNQSQPVIPNIQRNNSNNNK